MVKCHSSKVDLGVRFSYPALNIVGRDGSPSGLISLTPPVQLWYPQLITLSMEEIESRKMTRDGKVFTVFIVQSIRDVVDVVHENQIPREDLVSILKDKDGYAVFCYYK